VPSKTAFGWTQRSMPTFLEKRKKKNFSQNMDISLRFFSDFDNSNKRKLQLILELI
jgi:hypothetical protein